MVASVERESLTKAITKAYVHMPIFKDDSLQELADEVATKTKERLSQLPDEVGLDSIVHVPASPMPEWQAPVSSVDELKTALEIAYELAGRSIPGDREQHAQEITEHIAYVSARTKILEEAGQPFSLAVGIVGTTRRIAILGVVRPGEGDISLGTALASLEAPCKDTPAVKLSEPDRFQSAALIKTARRIR